MKKFRIPVGALPAGIFLLLMLVAPFCLLVVYSFWKADFFSVTPTFTLENFERLFTDALYARVLGKTLAAAALAASISVVIAYVVSYAIVFRFTVWGPRILVLMMASLLASYIVRIYALTTILGTNGLINNSLRGIGLIDAPLDYLLYGYPAIIIALVYLYLPIAVLSIFAGMQGIDPRLFEASRDLGRGHASTLLHVLLPLSRRGLWTAFIFTFILASADYVTPRMVGGVSGQMIGTIIADQFGAANNYPLGAALSLAMLVGFALVFGMFYGAERILVALWRLADRARRELKPVDTPRRPLLRLPSLRLPVAETVTGLTLAFLFVPLVTVFVFSFNEARNPGLPFTGVTLRWYGEIFVSPDFQRALLTSMKIASITVVGTLVLGLPAAIAMTRHSFALQKPFNLLVLSPMIIPGVVIGVALLTIFVTLGIRLGAFVTAAAHVMLVLPFVVQVLRNRLDKIDPRIDEAATDLGASRLYAARTITAPILLPAMLSAAVLALALSLDELLVTNFTIGRDVTVPVWIAARMRTGLTPALNAAAIMMLVGTLALIGLAGLWTRALNRRRAAQSPEIRQ